MTFRITFSLPLSKLLFVGSDIFKLFTFALLFLRDIWKVCYFSQKVNKSCEKTIDHYCSFFCLFYKVCTKTINSIFFFALLNIYKLFFSSSREPVTLPIVSICSLEINLCNKFFVAPPRALKKSFVVFIKARANSSTESRALTIGYF